MKEEDYSEKIIQKKLEENKCKQKFGGDRENIKEYSYWLLENTEKGEEMCTAISCLALV